MFISVGNAVGNTWIPVESAEWTSPALLEGTGWTEIVSEMAGSCFAVLTKKQDSLQPNTKNELIKPCISVKYKILSDMTSKYLFAAVSILIQAYMLHAQLPSKENFPRSSISNGVIEAVLFLPDTSCGFYRGARFDWSGVMPELNYKGHTFFGQWFEKYDPYIHDAIMGPVNDFSPVGYDDVKPGGKYVKIGIGTLLRPDDQAYSFSKQAKLVNPGKWKINRKRDQITFTHTLRDEPCSYTYTKNIKMVKGKPAMIMTHTLENTGKGTIETNVYNHNFFVIDKQPNRTRFYIRISFQTFRYFRKRG